MNLELSKIDSITHDICEENEDGYTVIKKDVADNFKYLGDNTGWSKDSYIIAKSKDKLVGVLAFGHYEEGKLFVTFVDVHKEYKRQGIATRLIQELNNHIDLSKPLYLTDLSKEGSLANITKLFQALINGDVIPGEDHYKRILELEKRKLEKSSEFRDENLLQRIKRLIK